MFSYAYQGRIWQRRWTEQEAEGGARTLCAVSGPSQVGQQAGSHHDTRVDGPVVTVVQAQVACRQSGACFLGSRDLRRATTRAALDHTPLMHRNGRPLYHSGIRVVVSCLEYHSFAVHVGLCPLFSSGRKSWIGEWSVEREIASPHTRHARAPTSHFTPQHWLLSVSSGVVLVRVRSGKIIPKGK